MNTGVLLARIQTVGECRSYVERVAAQSIIGRQRLLDILNSADVYLALGWGGTLYVWNEGGYIVTQLLFISETHLINYQNHLEVEQLESERLRALQRCDSH